MIKPFFTVKTKANDKDYGHFIIEPLPNGFGHTIGNGLRRVLLSFMPGTAVYQVKIKGVRHQFSTLKGLREDIVEFVLNLKKVNFHLDGNEPVKLTLTKVGPGEIHASDITLPASVTISNPDEYLGSLADKSSKIEAEIWIENGTGYLPSEQRQTIEIGVIPVDSLYSPVRRVNFTIEETRVGRETNYDRLNLEVWTNGSIDVLKTVHTAAELLVSYFKHVYEPTEDSILTDSEDKISDTILQTPVEEFDLSIRVTNALKKGGFKTLGDFVGKKRTDLEKVRNLGEKSIKLIEQQLTEKGIVLGS